MIVLHLLTNFHPVIGGLENFVLQLSRRSREQGIDARVLCLNRASRRDAKLPERDVVQGVPVQRVGFIDLVYYKPAMLPVEALCEADVIHVHGVGFNLDFTAATRRVHGRPYVVSTHGGIFHTPRLAAVKRFYFRQITRRSLAGAAAVVACGPQDRALFAPVAPAIRMIENAYELPPITSGVQRDERLVLHVGRLAANKRLDLLLRVFAAASSAVPGLRLRLVGPDWQGLGPGLWALAAELGIADRVALVGAVDQQQLAREYASAGLFLSASEHEGFGIAALEAMASGVVPVVSDIPAYRDLISDGHSGFLVNMSAPSAGEALARVAGMDLSSIRQAAIARAGEFSWERQLPKWIKLYESVASR